MPANRFFTNSPLALGHTIQIEGPEFHHLVHVMRARPGDIIEVVNGQGSLAEAIIRSVEKKCVLIEISALEQTPLPSFQIILAQAMPRHSKLDFIVEKGTELGMTQLWLFPAAHSEKKTYLNQQIDRMKMTTIAAMKQSGRLDLPTIEIRPELKKWSSLPFPAFFGDTSPSAPPFRNAWKESPPKEGVIFFIGPESGFNSQELVLLQKLGAQGVKLHENILRTETASLAALTLISHSL